MSFVWDVLEGEHIEAGSFRLVDAGYSPWIRKRIPKGYVPVPTEWIENRVLVNNCSMFTMKDENGQEVEAEWSAADCALWRSHEDPA